MYYDPVIRTRTGVCHTFAAVAPVAVAVTGR